MEVTQLVSEDRLRHLDRMRGARRRAPLAGLDCNWIVAVDQQHQGARELHAALGQVLPILEASGVVRSDLREWAFARRLHERSDEGMLAVRHPRLAQLTSAERDSVLALHDDHGVRSVQCAGEAGATGAGKVAFIHSGRAIGIDRNIPARMVLDDLLHRHDNETKLAKHAGRRVLVVFAREADAAALSEIVELPDPVVLPTWVTDIVLIDTEGHGLHLGASGWSQVSVSFAPPMP